MTFVYRYRPMDKLIGKHRELEKQELVLSSPRYLNDPLEGYQEVYWEGDKVLWENLIRNYLLNLLRATITSKIIDDETFDEHAVQPDLTAEDLPTDEYRDHFDSVCQSFFDERGFGKVPSDLASLPKPLKRKNLLMVLSVLHPSALESVFEALPIEEPISETESEVMDSLDSETVLEILETLSAVMADESEKESLESIGSCLHPINSHGFLQRVLETGEEELELPRKKQVFLSRLFPSSYVRELCETLIHPNWHILCFAEECTSPPMWATYADEHQGAALMFRTESQSDDSWAQMSVNEKTESSGSNPEYEQRQVPLYTVDYKSAPPQVDFFRFLGTLPRPKITSAWHSTPDGRTSPIVDEILEDVDAWRDNLWDKFHSMTTTKLGQWKYEQEVRMVIPDLLDSNGSHRAVTYDLSQLAGVVFGLRTTLEDRYEVMRILRKNSQGNDSSPVNFYQMVFDGTSFRKVKLDV